MEIDSLTPEEEFQNEYDALDMRFDGILSRLEELNSNASALINHLGINEDSATTNEVNICNYIYEYDYCKSVHPYVTKT